MKSAILALSAALANAADFRVSGTGVSVTNDGCITDGNGDYGGNERATITVLEDGELDVKSFHTNDEGDIWYGNHWRDLGVTKDSDHGTQLTRAEIYGGGGGSNHYIKNTKNYATSWVRKNGKAGNIQALGVSGAYERYAPGDNTHGTMYTSNYYNTYWYYVDYLTVNGKKYHGPDSPHGVAVKKGSQMQWRTDSRHNGDGFVICLNKNPAPKKEPAFQLVSGRGIEITASGCFTDGNGFYRSNEHAVVKVVRGGKLVAKHFSTEKTADKLIINGENYSGEGDNGPTGVVVKAGDKITWKSDTQMVRSGFIVCLDEKEASDPSNCEDWSCEEWCEYYDEAALYPLCPDDEDDSTCKCR
jgi:hypothetical protein